MRTALVAVISSATKMTSLRMALVLAASALVGCRSPSTESKTESKSASVASTSPSANGDAVQGVRGRAFGESFVAANAIAVRDTSSPKDAPLVFIIVGDVTCATADTAKVRKLNVNMPWKKGATESLVTFSKPEKDGMTTATGVGGKYNGEAKTEILDVSPDGKSARASLHARSKDGNDTADGEVRVAYCSDL